MARTSVTHNNVPISTHGKMEFPIKRGLKFIQCMFGKFINDCLPEMIMTTTFLTVKQSLNPHTLKGYKKKENLI